MQVRELRKVIVSSYSDSNDKSLMIFHRWISKNSGIVGLVEDSNGKMYEYQYQCIQFIPDYHIHGGLKLWDDVLQNLGYDMMVDKWNGVYNREHDMAKFVGKDGEQNA